MLLRSATIAFILAASVVPLAACSGSQSVGEPTVTANTGTTVAPISAVVTGRNKAIANALSQVALRADQRATIEQMAQDAETRAAPEHQAHQALALAIADQVQAGAIDRTALQPKIDAISAAHVASRPADRAAFEKLHDLLTPDQRVAFVTAMQANFGNHQGQGAAAGTTQQGPRQGWMRGRMQKWAADLGLTQAQQDQIRQQLQARWQSHVVGAVTGTDEQKTDAIQDGQMAFQGHAMHQQMKNTLEAFKGDTFSMDQVSPIQNEQPMAHQFAGHMLGMLETALPVLTQQQRILAANKLRERATNMEPEDEANEAVQQQPQAPVTK
jgi:hypothetical protein